MKVNEGLKTNYWNIGNILIINIILFKFTHIKVANKKNMSDYVINRREIFPYIFLLVVGEFKIFEKLSTMNFTEYTFA